ncbi:MAG: hypothetical protein ACSHW1_21345 [Yoonia sp.]|uniref:hypothetical protein n=1 Tax=Yoonia sp. TaxID=2212373 RepID=UPI003EF856D4
MSIGLIIALALSVYVGFIYWHWRRDERINPDTRFKGIAPVRFAKHFIGAHVDGLLYLIP